jgi:hypothetical protein
MLGRDVAVLFACAVAVLLTLQGRGEIKARVEWVEEIDVTQFSNEHFPQAHERLPRPIITDLDGDGLNEVIVATREPGLRILSVPRPPSSAARGDPVMPRLRRKATLLGAVRVAKGRHPVALATGYLDAYGTMQLSGSVGGRGKRGERDRVKRGSKEAAQRKQVIVVLTESFVLMCFDHKLRLMWETTLNHMEETLGLGHLVPDEVSLMVAPTPLHKHDRGVVIVGGSMRRADGTAGSHMHGRGTDDARRSSRNKRGGRGQGAGHAGMAHLRQHDPVGGERARGRRVGNVTIPPEPPMPDPNSLHWVAPESAERVDEWKDHEMRDGYHARLRKAEHFSFYAVDGARGQLRWKHEAGDFHDALHSEDMVKPAHQYKIDDPDHATGEGGRHTFEKDWRAFRQSVLDSLPHSVSRREDVSIDLGHFTRHRSGKRRRRWTDHGGQADGLAGAAGVSADPLVSSLLPTAGLKDVIQGFTAPHAPADQVVHPNVVVAHTRQGIEVVHLYSGRTLTQLRLPGEVHHGEHGHSVFADINGDRVIDHVQTIPGNKIGEGAHRAGAHRSVHFSLPSCFVQVSSGVPPMEQLFNGSICHDRGTVPHASLDEGFNTATQNEMREDDKVMTAKPLLIPRRVSSVGEGDTAGRTASRTIGNIFGFGAAKVGAHGGGRGAGGHGGGPGSRRGGAAGAA